MHRHLTRHLTRHLVPLLALTLLSHCNDKSRPPAPIPSSLSESDYSGQRAYEHCRALCALGPRTSGSPAYEQQLSYLEQQLQKAGWQTERHHFSGPNGLPFTNLRATYGGEPSRTRPLLLSCHIDTKRGIPNFIGADDGASAAAALLEIARCLPQQQPGRCGQIEILFFDGEESIAPRMSDSDGLYGSKHDVARRANNLPRWQINLDMVGGRDKEIGVPLGDTPESMLMQYELAVRTLNLDNRRWSIAPTSYLDDHRPYADAGVATLNLIARFQQGGWWHTERDNLERICPDSLHETGLIVLQLIRQLIP